MNNLLLGYIALLFIAVLIQVSILPVPLGVILILIWSFMKGTDGLVVLAVIFSIVLASLANIATYLVLLSTIITLGFFMFGRQILPNRWGITLTLIIASVIIWEISSFTLGQINL